jgi:hypothetical protein
VGRVSAVGIESESGGFSVFEGRLTGDTSMLIITTLFARALTLAARPFRLEHQHRDVRPTARHEPALWILYTR